MRSARSATDGATRTSSPGTSSREIRIPLCSRIQALAFAACREVGPLFAHNCLASPTIENWPHRGHSHSEPSLESATRMFSLAPSLPQIGHIAGIIPFSKKGRGCPPLSITQQRHGPRKLQVLSGPAFRRTSPRLGAFANSLFLGGGFFGRRLLRGGSLRNSLLRRGFGGGLLHRGFPCYRPRCLVLG